MNKCYSIKLFLLMLFTLVVLLAGGISKKEVKEKMTEHLKNTYNKEFVVEEPVLSGNEGFGYRVYNARAYPVDEPEMSFWLDGR
ncbi:hypothetical protein ABCY62_01460 [Acetivibrio clariflavus]|uniref:hypothetical protein n=1 Tax=Acetivibrio clariflavus TaxID=288965 RepID=UPI0031F56E6E